MQKRQVEWKRYTRYLHRYIILFARQKNAKTGNANTTTVPLIAASTPVCEWIIQELCRRSNVTGDYIIIYNNNNNNIQYIIINYIYLASASTLYNNIIIQTTTEAAAAVAQSIIQILATVSFSFYTFCNCRCWTKPKRAHTSAIIYNMGTYDIMYNNNVYNIPLRPCCRRRRRRRIR